MRQKIVHRLRKITRNDSQRIAGRIVNAAVTQIDDDVAGVFVGTLAGEGIIGGDTGLERIGPVVNGGGGWCAQNRNILGDLNLVV